MFFAKALCIKAESLHFNQIKFENYIFNKEDLYSLICLHSWVSLQFSHAVRLNSVFIAQLGDFLSHQADCSVCFNSYFTSVTLYFRLSPTNFMDKDFCFSVMLLNEIAADSLSKKLDPCLCIFLTNSISCRQLICWHSGMQCQALPAFNIDPMCRWETKRRLGLVVWWQQLRASCA